jgi:cytoskeletal protein RodZ
MSDFSELEAQLRKLRPAQPSVDLVERIERALAQPETSTPTAGVLPRERRFHFNWLSLGLGLAGATALVLLAVIQINRPATKKTNVASITPAPSISTSNPQFVPAGLTQVVYHTRDEGIHFPTNSEQPMRRVRSHTRETLQWRNPKTGATLRISYPKEQVSLLPVSGQ